MRPTDSQKQQSQESTYALPTHWFVDPRTRRGRRKYGRIQRLFALVPPAKLSGKRVLDVGCGDGWVTKEFVARGAQVTGVDFSERALSFARLLVPNASFFHNDGTALPFADASFDYIFFLEVLEHIPPAEIQTVLAELRRVLAPQGELILSVPSTLRDVRKFRAHFQHFSPETLRKTLSPVFRIEELLGQDQRVWWLDLLSKVYENRFWTLWPVAALFNQRVYIKYWSNASLARAGHLFVRCVPEAYVGT
ncbi:methyltransferase domain-containing protein [Patescibacteria group bacterium]|nr:methyltransferase domain-containing protein [Patescibacteria group bacterium]